jgi:hypothetical protein
MHTATLRLLVDTIEIEQPTIDEQIRDFLDGETNGEGLLEMLYGDVADEPVPERLLAVLRG